MFSLLLPPHPRTRHLGADGYRPRGPAWLRLAPEAAPGGVALRYSSCRCETLDVMALYGTVPFWRAYACLRSMAMQGYFSHGYEKRPLPIPARRALVLRFRNNAQVARDVL